VPVTALLPGWTRTRMSTLDAGIVSLDVPPGWWLLRPASEEVSAEIDRVVTDAVAAVPDPERAQPVAAELAEDLHRMVRVAATGGAVLLAAGANVDGDTGQLVTASLLVAPYDRYGDPDRPEWTEGPAHRMALPAGVAVRRTRLGIGPSPFGAIRVLALDYAIVPPVPPSWVLAFQTPALRHVAELCVVFDAIARCFHIGSPADTPDPVFA
jgi:hypothetical protein